MAFVTSDAELMWNVLPAVALPAQTKFLTARDRDGNPMVFGIGGDHEFHVAQEGHSSKLRQLVALCPPFGLAKDTQTVAFDLKQGADDTIYLSFAVEEQSRHRLFVVEPFKPQNIDFTDSNAKLKVIESTRLDNISIREILLGEVATDGHFPSLILNYLDTKSGMENLKHFEVLDDFRKLENKGDLSLPIDTKKVICYTTGRFTTRSTIRYGVFALHSQGAARGLIFSSYSDQFESTLVCPPSASYISTFNTDNGDTDLIVGGDGLWRFSARDIKESDAEGTLICSGTFFQGVQQIYIAQTTSSVCIWVRTKGDGISYFDFAKVSVPKAITEGEARGVPLVTDGKGGNLAGFRGRGGRNAVLVTDARSKMTYLEQSPDTLIWKNTPFWFPSSENTLKLYSYTTRVVVRDDAARPVSRASIAIASTGWTNLIVNGQPFTLGSTPVELQTDAEGALNIINPTTDLSSYQFTVSKLTDGAGKDLGLSAPLLVNPMNKVEQALSGMTVDKLLQATLTDGKPVFSQSSTEELKTAVEYLKDIDSARNERAISLTNIHANAAIHSHTLMRSAANVHDAIASNSIGDKIIKAAWDVWYFVESAWEKVKDWGIKVYEGVKTFVVSLGEQIYHFALDTADRIAKAASFVYNNYLKAPLEKLVDWFRNFFSWPDIVETKDSIVDFINASFDYVDKNVTWAADKADEGFDELNQLIRDRLSPKNIPASVQSRKAGPQEQSNVGSKEKDLMQQTDVKQNWTKYQLTHGGAIEGAVIVDAAGAVVDEFQKTWDDIITPTLQTMQNHSQILMDDLSLFFKENADFTAGDILQKIGVDVLIGILDTVRSLLRGILVRIARVVRDFKDLLNKQIKVPIFSDLWVEANKLFNRDVDPPTFSVINFIGFVLAIPITLTCKIFTGNKPHALPKLNALTLEKFFRRDASKEDTLAFNGFCGMIEAASASTLAITGLVSAAGLGLGALLAKWFDFEFVFGVVRVAACWPTRQDLPLWQVRKAVWVADAVDVLVLAISRKVEAGGQAEKVVAGISGGVAILNIGLNMAVNIAELTENWNEKDEERTGYQILISVLGGAATIGKSVSTISPEPTTKLAGVMTKQVAGKAAGFFNVVNTYTSVSKGKYISVINSGA